jgi:hypothetical protein
VTDTVLVNVPAVVPAVNRPVCVIVPPPATTAQTGWRSVLFVPSFSVPTIVNCCVPPVARVTVVGETTIESIVRGPLSLQAVMAVPANATAIRAPAIRVRVNARRMGLFMTVLIELS